MATLKKNINHIKESNNPGINKLLRTLSNNEKIKKCFVNLHTKNEKE